MSPARRARVGTPVEPTAPARSVRRFRRKDRWPPVARPCVRTPGRARAGRRRRSAPGHPSARRRCCGSRARRRSGGGRTSPALRRRARRRLLRSPRRAPACGRRSCPAGRGPVRSARRSRMHQRARARPPSRRAKRRSSRRRSDGPGRTPTTFVSLRDPFSVVASNLKLLALNPAALSRAATSSAVRSSWIDPDSRAPSFSTSWSAVVIARWALKLGGASSEAIGEAWSWSENASTISASSAGMKAAR